MEKYGPGPRVHFHIGYFDSPDGPPATANISAVRHGLFHAQERLIELAVARWASLATLGHHVLDMGCGLGGTTLWWAQNLRCEVTALTCVAEHAALIERLATEAGVANVRVRLGDAHDAIDDGHYDTAMAWEAACYFDRYRWFTALRRLLRPGSMVFVEDTFLSRPSAWKSIFDSYWHTDVAPVEQYRSAAEASGFHLLDDVDVTPHTTAFWTWSIAWNQRRLELHGADGPHLRQSIAAHLRMRTAWECDAIRVRLLAFQLM